MLRGAVAAGAVALVIATFFYGRHVGVVATRASYEAKVAEAQTEAIRAADLASRKEAERLVAEAARADMAQQLEDEARAEPATTTVALPLSRVLRLNSR